jgi:hypothetical protein
MSHEGRHTADTPHDAAPAHAPRAGPPAASADYPPQQPLGKAAAIAFLMISGVFILALGLWLGTRPQRPTVPQLTLVEPRDGAAVDTPVELIFDVDRARIRIGPGGWGYGTMHLHVLVDGLEVMPGPDDIEYVGSPSRWRWTLPPVAPGERSLHLFWSDLRHRPVEDGAAETIRVHVR